MRDSLLVKLFLLMAPLSFASIGGATGIYAPLQHESVDVLHWLSPREFLDLFALARVTPGPGSMLGALIGWKVAGLSGALVATLGLYLPSSALCFAVAQVWSRYRGTPWHRACEAGLTPVAAGLIFAGGLALLRLSEANPFTWATVAIVAALLTWRPKLHPILLIGVGGVLFFAIHFVST
jgi:chromate transporter